MEQIQVLLHEQAAKLIQEHPEIFEDETHKPKEKGAIVIFPRSFI